MDSEEAIDINFEEIQIKSIHLLYKFETRKSTTDSLRVLGYRFNKYNPNHMNFFDKSKNIRYDIELPGNYSDVNLDGDVKLTINKTDSNSYTEEIKEYIINNLERRYTNSITTYNPINHEPSYKNTTIEEYGRKNSIEESWNYDPQSEEENYYEKKVNGAKEYSRRTVKGEIIKETFTPTKYGSLIRIYEDNSGTYKLDSDWIDTILKVHKDNIERYGIEAVNRNIVIGLKRSGTTPEEKIIAFTCDDSSLEKVI